MSKRNAMRIGNPHNAESIAFTVERYGKIQPETLAEIVAWLKEHSDEYEWEVGEEYLPASIEGAELVGENSVATMTAPHPIIKTRRKTSAIYKIIDNEHDAQNTLANIRNKDFPKNKQGQ